ncbi:hypothetical protein COV61_03230 [Candidatus Micrarchaeota archaeon CG11_big_fil_rev_8_21_14_0_20_47_5]|nr:MAG: hypothetical protein AUJ17_01915 [Candidatus Micrarchaeota archaeon CG1_02_47_40]PIN83383.1 MAG: hypothetical protein COV61_03230 [Candidatus Micrarchaeota archaeon CG11_big_fil_rev_8_21_14_0_20_47_5]
MKKLSLLILLLALFSVAPFSFAIAMQSENVARAGQQVITRFFAEDGVPARGIMVRVSNGVEEMALKTDNAGYIYFTAKEGGENAYSYSVAREGNPVLVFEEKTHVAGEASQIRAEGEESSLITNAMSVASEMKDVLISSASLILPLFIVFLLASLAVVYYILKD